MKFQPGQSGNPAGRPPGSLNKRTRAAQALLEEHAEEIVQNLMDRAKNGEATPIRLCMDRLAPSGRNRAVAIDLPMVRTPEDAEAALTVVLAEVADGKLTIAELSALISAIDRMLRLADRIWKSKQVRRAEEELQALEALATRLARDEEADARQPPAQTGAPADASLYFPVNSEMPGDEAGRRSLGDRGDLAPSDAPLAEAA